MNNACIISPIHPPKFNYGVKFLESYKQYFDDNDLYLIFSNSNDLQGFVQYYGSDDFKYLIVNVETFTKNGGIITNKKFHGLRQIFDSTNFKYVGVIDVDSEFISYKKYSELFENFVINKTLYANVSTNYFVKNEVINSSLKFFNADERHKLQNILNYNLYFWFNDVPVYERNNYDKFWNFICSKLNNVAYTDFDYIVYAYYLLVNDSMSLSVVKNENDSLICNLSFIESQSEIEEKIFKKAFNDANPMWIKNEIEDMKNVFIKLHTDRK